MQTNLFQFVVADGAAMTNLRKRPREIKDKNEGIENDELKVYAPLETIVGSMYSIPLRCLSRSALRKHMDNLTMIPKDTFAKSDGTFFSYVISDERIFVPRWYGIKHFGPARYDETNEGTDFSADADFFRGSLLPHQIEATDIVLNEMTGAGGTFAPSPRGE